MIKYLLILFLGCFLAFSIQGQESDFTSIDGVVNGYYSAVGLESEDARKSAFQSLFTESGTISSVINTPSGPSRVKLSNWIDVVEESGRFYTQFSLKLQEEKRTADYYLDQAVVHSIVKQSSLNKSTNKTYTQMLWIEFDLVYFDDRWWIQAVSWIDQEQSTLINNAIITDTLWHQRN